jgi:hypothetical protein
MRVLGFKILEEDEDHGGVFMTIGEGTHVIDLVPLPGGDITFDKPTTRK